ncbi:MAG TPA: hypothetical protein VJV05_16845 [Pyrinomonadaceae bacterium]|nr:hypothetical protein [Pyrinomonadaceae bacterium]
MELLIPGLILVALMAYASTRIKKRAAEAFDAEPIDNPRYSLVKPAGFLHVLSDPNHDFMAYSKEFGEDENARHRRATIEVDTINGSDIEAVCAAVRESASEIRTRDGSGVVMDVDEQANETEFRTVYKIIADTAVIYRLRFAVVADHFDEYTSRVDDTIESFAIK